MNVIYLLMSPGNSSAFNFFVKAKIMMPFLLVNEDYAEGPKFDPYVSLQFC